MGRLELHQSLLRMAEGVMLAGAVFALLAALVPVAGSNGLDILTELESVAGIRVERTTGIAFEAQLVSNPRIDGAERLMDPDGLTDGGTDAVLAAPFRTRVVIEQTSDRLRLAWVAWRAAAALLWVGGFWLAYGLAKSTRTGDPFTIRNSGRILGLAFLVGAGGSAVSQTGEWLRIQMLALSDAAPFVVTGYRVAYAPLVAGLLLWVLAGLWRYATLVRIASESALPESRFPGP